MTHLLLWGNAYSQIIRNGKGEIIALYPLMPDRMTVDRDDNGRIYYQYLTLIQNNLQLLAWSNGLPLFGD
jgi:phage portal protein BeeE